MNQTDCLGAFPFLAQQQVTVSSLIQQFPVLAAYDVQADWDAFVTRNKPSDQFSVLRQFRQSRLAYIAQSDFSHQTQDHGVAMQKTSALADFLVQQALSMAQHDIQERMGQVVDQSGLVVPFVILALGKLGTCELNYSSDIDLVFISGGSGQSNGKRSIDSSQYFERLGRKVIQLLDQFTASGRVYRVDMRLRPFGSAAPLVCTAAALQNYIITEGREWERFAWMRARCVAGNEALAQEVLGGVRPFIYRKHLDYSVFDSLAAIKRDMSLSAQDHELDLKLGAGGIREIEFIVQSLQVTFGGRLPQLQGVAIGPQFQTLACCQKMKPDNAAALEAAWLFIRRLENLSQIQNDEQTHVLPDDPFQLLQLAKIMGFEDWASCEQRWRQHREVVQQLFQKLFANEAPSEHMTDDASRWVRQTMESYFIQKVPQARAEHIQKLLIRACQLNDVDSLAQGLLPILQAIMRRPSYVLMLLQEQSLLPAMLELIDKNDYFVTAWVQHPALLELLFEPEMMPEELNEAFFQQEWLQVSGQELDEEQWMEAVRFFKHKQQFKLIQTALRLGLSDQYLRQGFSALAAFFVRLVVKKGWQETHERLGDCALQSPQMMVLAYGSLGVSHMSLHSDLDLVFVIDVDVVAPEQMLFLQRWAKRISHHLMVKTYHGVLYHLDLQLRPNGNAGALVTSRKEFEQYQSKAAWVWEHAALIKASLLGSEAQQIWFKSLKKKLLCQPRESKVVIKAMRDMHEKLNQFGSQNHSNELLLLERLLLVLPQQPELLEARSYQQLLNMAVKQEVVDQTLADELLNQKSPI